LFFEPYRAWIELITLTALILWVVMEPLEWAKLKYRKKKEQKEIVSLIEGLPRGELQFLMVCAERETSGFTINPGDTTAAALCKKGLLDKLGQSTVYDQYMVPSFVLKYIQSNKILLDQRRQQNG
jgi:hypothetical protein